MIKNRMNTKNLMVSFVAIAMALFLVATVSAATVISADTVSVNGVYLYKHPAITAGETVTIKVEFTADVNAPEVVIKAELGDNSAETSKFPILSGESYEKVLNIKVPYDFDDDELTNELDLEITIKGKDTDADEKFKETVRDVELTVQRPSYNVEIKPIHVPSSVEAGEKFSVDVIVENNGYNDLDDLYLTARIEALDVEETFYIGDLTDVEEDEDDSTVHKRIRLEVPYDAQAGEYTLEIEVSNEDANIAKATVVVTENSLPNQVIKTDTGLIIINPTDKIAVYTVLVESPATVSESTVIVESDSTATVTVNPNVEGEYNFTVSVLNANGELVRTVTFSGSEEASQIASPIVMLTIVLGIIFLVLLVVLIVLVTKKPEKAEEFGESYY